MSLITAGKESILHHQVPSLSSPNTYPMYFNIQYLLSISAIPAFTWSIPLLSSRNILIKLSGFILFFIYLIHLFFLFLLTINVISCASLISSVKFPVFDLHYLILLSSIFCIHLLFIIAFASPQSHFLFTVTHILLWICGHLVKWTFTSCHCYFQSLFSICCNCSFCGMKTQTFNI